MQWTHELEVLLKAIKQAGAALLTIPQEEFDIHRKKNHDIVTKGDLLVNDILREHLMFAFPQDGWLSEESVDEMSRLQMSRVWIVDPIDGTKEFAAGIPEYGISVALVEQGIPVVAAIYNPVADELFYAVKDHGAWLNQMKIECAPALEDGQAMLLASRSEYHRGEWDQFADKGQIKIIGSIAYKLALIAAGRAHATFSLGFKNEWDIAAGVLLVQEAGGKVSDKTGKAFRFNQENVLVNGVVAACPAFYSQLMGLI